MNNSNIAVSESPFISEEIEALDFTMIKLKLQDADEGPGWSTLQCEQVEEEYRRFLFLKHLYPDKDIVPNRSLDIFWHQHILDTEKYAIDCENVFGFFMHHYPYFGMNGAQDAQNLTDAFEETAEIYKSHFGSEYAGSSTRCKAPKCRTQCKPMKCK